MKTILARASRIDSWFAVVKEGIKRGDIPYNANEWGAHQIGDLMKRWEGEHRPQRPIALRDLRRIDRGLKRAA